MATSPGHLSSVERNSFFGRLQGGAKGLFLFKLVEDPLVHALLLDLIFGYLIGLMPTYATICTYLLYHHGSAWSWCSPTKAISQGTLWTLARYFDEDGMIRAGIFYFRVDTHALRDAYYLRYMI